MPTYTEGTRAWAQQQAERAYILARDILKSHGFNRDAELYCKPWDAFVSETHTEGEARDTAYHYNQLVNEFWVMQDYIEEPPVADDGVIIYTVEELEAAGQRRLFA